MLNFAAEQLDGTVYSASLNPGDRVTDAFDGTEVGIVDDVHSFALTLDGYQGRALLVLPSS